ncbi:MAG: potassium-transporting ATPase subunit KdpA [Candidatus Eremiobacteraeota bacterium]|nr:potassium-transporting ATPase subunit KdpA [Candidatus Eremiobacteraeota bacterium]
MGAYIARVFAGERTLLSPVLVPVENAIYRVCRIEPETQMRWPAYLFAMLAFSASGIAALYVLLRVQQWLPLNPQHATNLSADSAWNTAVSFATTCDWEAFTPETALSTFSQMAGLAWQNFAAAGVGLALAIAFVRGLTRSRDDRLGNFWVDLTRGIVYVLLPLAIVFGMAFVSQGVPQTLGGYVDVQNAEGAKQTLVLGPLASQEAISVLGGNGGGFVAANVASPNENPAPLANALQIFEMLLIPAALTFTFGRMVRDARQGWALFVAMMTIVVAGVAVGSWAESAGNPAIHALGAAGGNFEGKEVRFGAAGAGLSLAAGTDATTGQVNAALDSMMPLSNLVALIDMQIGEVAFGGVGSGLYGMLVFVVLTVFIGGLMVGRTPEYLGKKIERREVQYAMLAVLLFPAAILFPAALAVLLPAATSAVGNPGPHGFTEMLYAFVSTAASNGSAFGGLMANTLFYNLATGIAMLLGRYAVAIPTLALAGAVAARPVNLKASQGAFSTATPLFVGLLLAVIVVVGALTFLPADLLGPVDEQLRLGM